MHCFLGCLALAFPRLVLVLVWLFSDYLGDAYRGWLLPLLGFFFLPTTTLAYAWAWHLSHGEMSFLGVLIVIVGLMIDLGCFSQGESSRRKVKAARESRNPTL